MKKSYFRKAVAVLMAAVMCIGMMPAMAFAEEKEPEKVNLVVFGNSTSSGYGMPDFYNRNNGFATLNNYLEQWAADEDGFTPEKWAEDNFGDTSDWTDQSFWTLKAAEDFAKKHSSISRMSNFAYPWQLKKYMSLEEGKKVNLIPITMNGMRTDELRAFLDKDYYDKANARELAYGERYIEDNNIPADKADAYRDGFLSAHTRWYAGDFADSKAINNSSYESASAYVKQSIKDADVIVMDLCGNNFGTYIGYRLSAFLGLEKRYASNTYETIADVEGLPEPLMKSIVALKDELKGRVDVFNTFAGSQLLESYLYAVADCIVNFSADMEMIHEINPDAKVIAVGLNNPMAGLYIQAGDTKVDFGEISAKMFDMVNTYMRVLDKNAGNYYYAHTPMDLTTLTSTVGDAESLEALLNDGSYEDGRGSYAIDSIYQSFINEFMGGEEGDYKTVYDMIQSAIKSEMKSDSYQLIFKSWDALAEDEQIMVKPQSYLTVDPEKLAAASTQEELFGAFGVSGKKPKEANYFKKETVKIVAAKYAMMNLTPDQLSQLQQAAIDAGYTTEDEIKAYIYQYCYSQVTDENIAQAYQLIQNGLKGVEELKNASDFSDLSETECVTFNPLGSEIGLRFDPSAQSIDKAIVIDGGIPLTKEVIREITRQNIKPSIENMLYEALHEHGTLDIASLQDALGDMGKTTKAIQDYLTAVMTGDETATLDEAYWALLVIEERFLLSSGVGEHPSATGCTEKYEAIRDAYLSDTTASEEVKEEVTAKLKELYAKIQEIAEKIKETEEYQKIMEELQPIIDQLKVYGYALYALPEYEEAIDAYGKAVELFANEIADLQDTVDGLEQGNAELISQLDDLQKETDGLVAQLDAVKKQNEELEKKATSYKGEIEKLNAMIKDLEEDLAALQFAQEKVKLKKVTAGKKSFTAKWKKLDGADGYQVSYKVGKKTSKKAVKGGSKTKLKVKKLKSGKKYTVKVRAYKTVKGKKVYSKWSSGKKVTVK